MEKQLVENPKEPHQLFQQNLHDPTIYEPVLTRHGEKPIWVCGECGTLHVQGYNQDKDVKQAAYECCLLKKCDCGKVKEIQYYTKCRSCSDAEDAAKVKKRYDDAELVDSAPDDWIYCEGYGSNDGFFDSVDSLIEWVQEQEDEDDALPMPEFAFVCEKVEFKNRKMDAHDIVNSELESDFHEDAMDQVTDLDSLQEFLDQWVKKQRVASFDPDYGRKIKVVV